MILHYMHYQKQWFYWFDEYTDKKYYRKYNDPNIIWIDENIITERQCREYLKEKYPDVEIIKSIAYHYSPGPGGSRPIKETVDRKKMLKEKKEFIKELENNN